MLECYTPIMSAETDLLSPPGGLVQQKREKPGSLHLLMCTLLALFAFYFNWATGHRGIDLLDQSMIIDGGWRILQGQIPYKDFLIPFVPVTFYIQALFFRLFGVNWTATVLSACLLNVVATLSVIRMVRLLLGDRSRVLAWCAGFGTAVCFQAPFGTLWLEQTAMFFDLLALQAAVESLHAAGFRRSFWQVACGISLAVAMFSKQNFGTLFVPIVFAVLVAGELPDLRRVFRSILIAGAGLAAGLAIFVGWVRVFSDWPSFVQRAIVVAGEIGRTRLTPTALAHALTFEAVPNAFQIDLLGILAGGIALSIAFSNLWSKDSNPIVWRELAPVNVIAIVLPVFHSVTQTTTLNEFQNSFAFVPLVAALAAGLLFRVMDYVVIAPAVNLRLPSARSVKIFLSAAIGLWGLMVLVYIGKAAWARSIQEFTKGTRFSDAIQVRGMEWVRWGEPTLIDFKSILPRADFENLASYLSAKKDTFFVMGDTTMLYALLGTPSPQPMLYFLPGHSYLPREIPQLDEMVSESLKRNNVRVVVREKVTFLPDVHDAYPQFPRTWAWFTSHFEHAKDFGNYEVWEWRADGSK